MVSELIYEGLLEGKYRTFKKNPLIYELMTLHLDGNEYFPAWFSQPGRS
jgi:hypothetical protein